MRAIGNPLATLELSLENKKLAIGWPSQPIDQAADVTALPPAYRKLLDVTSVAGEDVVQPTPRSAPPKVEDANGNSGSLRESESYRLQLELLQKQLRDQEAAMKAQQQAWASELS